MRELRHAAATSLVLASALFFTGCEDDHTLTDAYNPINMDGNVQVSAVTDGTVTYTFTGDVPELSVGDVIGSSQGNGFLRRVSAVQVSGNSLIVQTEQARLTDAVEEGDFQESVLLQAGAQAEAARQLVAVHQLKGVGVSERGVQLRNVTIYSGGGLTVTIPRGSIDFGASLDIGGKIRKGKISEFHAIAGGNMAVDVDLVATASKTLTYGREVSIARYSATAFQFIGPVPVVEVITLEFMAGFEASMTGSMTVTTGVNGDSLLRLGAEYDGSWHGVREASMNLRGDTPTFSGSAGITLRGYVRPQITVSFYGIAGPYLGVEPYLEFGGTLVSDPAINWGLYAGVDIVVGFNISLLGYDLFDYNHHFNVWSKRLASGQFGVDYNASGTWDLRWYEGSSYGTHTLTLTRSHNTLSGSLGANPVAGTTVGNFVTFVRPGSPDITFTGTMTPGSTSMSGTWDDTMGTDRWTATRR